MLARPPQSRPNAGTFANAHPIAPSAGSIWAHFRCTLQDEAGVARWDMFVGEGEHDGGIFDVTAIGDAGKPGQPVVEEALCAAGRQSSVEGGWLRPRARVLDL